MSDTLAALAGFRWQGNVGEARALQSALAGQVQLRDGWHTPLRSVAASGTTKLPLR